MGQGGDRHRRDGGVGVKRFRTSFWLLLAVSFGFVQTACAQAQPAEEFFRGKTLRFTVVYEPGGTYDLYSRLLIMHLPKHIPGNPAIAMQYMPGAGGMVGTVNLYEKAARDGTQLGMLPRDIAVNQMLHPDAARYDAKRFSWIGRVASCTGVMLVMSRTGVKSAEDLRRIQVVAASWGNTTDSFVTPTLLNVLAGTRFKIVTGYRGAADVDLAIERGEADARVASWTALKTTRGEWLKDGRIVVPFQTGLTRHADLPDLPLISDLATSDDGRRILEFMNSDASVGWNVIAPPEVPQDRVAALRSAFDATVRDPDFLADAQKQGLEIVPGSGDEVQQVVEHTLATPPGLVAHVAAIVGGQN
jgi:tripartite-type tricarboxylate transporter receptor subunit TctC